MQTLTDKNKQSQITTLTAKLGKMLKDKYKIRLPRVADSILMDFDVIKEKVKWMLGLLQLLDSLHSAGEQIAILNSRSSDLASKISEMGEKVHKLEGELEYEFNLGNNAVVRVDPRKSHRFSLSRKPPVSAAKPGIRKATHEAAMEILAKWGELHERVKNRREQIVHESFADHCDLDVPDFIRFYLPGETGQQHDLGQMRDFLTHISRLLGEFVDKLASSDNLLGECFLRSEGASDSS